MVGWLGLVGLGCLVWFGLVDLVGLVSLVIVVVQLVWSVWWVSMFKPGWNRVQSSFLVWLEVLFSM